MKYGLITIVGLMLLALLAGGCRQSSIAQAQGPAMTPEQVGAALTTQLSLILSKHVEDYTDADVALLKAISDAAQAYEDYTGALPAFMSPPEELWTNEQVARFSEIKYRLDTQAEPPPTQAEIDAMQEYFEYYDLYNEYLLAQQSGGSEPTGGAEPTGGSEPTGGGEGGGGEVPQDADPYASVSG